MKKVLSNRIEYRNEAGQLHREDGPAVEWDNGDKKWYINGKCHRLDGPAREWSDGYKSWWVNGECFSQQNFEQHPLVLQEKQRKQELEFIERIRNNKNKISRWRLL